MANLEAHNDSVKEVKNSAEKEKVLAESKKELNDLKNEMESEEITSKKVENLIKDGKLDNWLKSKKWNKNLEKSHKKYILRFLNFDYWAKVDKGMKNAIWEKAFDSIKAIAKKSGSYEKLPDSKKMEIWKLLFLAQTTAGYYESKNNEQHKKFYNYCKPLLEAQINKMK